MSNYTPDEEQVREQYTREKPPQIGTAAEEARAEAERRYPESWDHYNDEPVDDWGYSECQREAFCAGVVWADANPKPHTITRDEFDEACVELDNEQGWACLGDLIYAVCAALGIEVEDDSA